MSFPKSYGAVTWPGYVLTSFRLSTRIDPTGVVRLSNSYCGRCQAKSPKQQATCPMPPLQRTPGRLAHSRLDGGSAFIRHLGDRVRKVGARDDTDAPGGGSRSTATLAPAFLLGLSGRIEASYY